MRDMANRRVTRRDTRREATKVSVLNAARDVFLAQGFERTTIKAIADAAGVSPGTVLNAEPTKAALLVAILKRESEPIAESAEQLEGALSGAALDKITALLQLLLDGHLRHTELFSAAIGHSWLDTGSDYQSAFEQLDFAWDSVRRTVAAGVEAGEIKASLNQAAIMHVLRNVVFSAVREGAREDGADPRETLSARLEIVLSGLKA